MDTNSPPPTKDLYFKDRDSLQHSATQFFLGLGHWRPIACEPIGKRRAISLIQWVVRFFSVRAWLLGITSDAIDEFFLDDRLRAFSGIAKV